MPHRSKKLFVLLALGLVAGCSNDDGGSSGQATTTVNGSVFASQVGNATVTVKDTAGATVAGPVTTASDGTYALNVPNASLSQNLVFESTGGTFTDEATGDTGVAADALGAYVAGGTLGSGDEVHLTPGSTIVKELVQTHGHSLTDAEAHFADAFGFDVDVSIAPLSAATTPPLGATEDRLRAGLHAAAFSQLTMDLGMAPGDQFQLFEHLAEDLADDDILDGVTGSLDEDIQNRYVRALLNFRNGGNDHTGLTADKIGALPFANVALTNTYRVEYVPGMMGAAEGKTEFSLHVTNRTSGQGVTGLTLTLDPVMHMSTMSHGSAVDGCTESGTAGVHDCSVYYLMASTMAGGTSMGYWNLAVLIDDGTTQESAEFTPNVMMAMGDTVRAALKGQADMIPGMGMMGATQRTYYLFTDSVTTTTLDLFIAARETMMSHPPVSAGTVLNVGDMTYELTVGTMTVEVSTDSAFSSPIIATDNGDGHWSASGISGLTENQQGTLYVRLTVNSEQKTTTGSAPSGANAYATFLVTP
jgi:hypothetical protein